MNVAFKLRMAKQLGDKTAREHGFAELPIDPIKIASDNDLVVQAKPDTAEGVSGMLLRHGDNFGIMYATQIRNEGFQHFSIAHELGHFFLDGHIDHVLPKDGVHSSRAGFVASNQYELEADHFAAGLLMPERLFKRVLGKSEPGITAIEYVSGICKTSLESTAIRYAELCEEAIAVVLSTGDKIDYCCMSDGLKSIHGLTWLRKGTPVPLGTVTSQFNSDRERVLRADRDDRQVDILDWLGGDRSIIATEEVIGLGSYGKTLTILHCPSIIDDTYSDETEDEEDEDAMIDRWTPKL